MKYFILILSLVSAGLAHAERASKYVEIGALKRTKNGIEISVEGKSYNVVTEKCYWCLDDNYKFGDFRSKDVISRLTHLPPKQIQCVEKAVDEIEIALSSVSVLEKTKALKINGFDVNFKYHLWSSQHKARPAGHPDIAIGVDRSGHRMRVEILAYSYEMDNTEPDGCGFPESLTIEDTILNMN